MLGVIVLLAGCGAPPEPRPDGAPPAAASAARGSPAGGASTTASAGHPTGPAHPTAPGGPAAAPQRASLPPLPDPVPGGTCPADMAPVPAVDPRFCIDRYEAHVVDDVARSEPGVLPTVGLTFDEAAAACARAEVRAPDGAVRGHKRLARAIEWEDAADGRVGTGGRAFPYGDTWVSGRCNVPDLPGTQAPGGLGPTGAFADCHTPEGVHDQLGNAWEWTDSDLRLDVAGWLGDAAPLGVHRDGDGLRVDAAADLARLRPVVNAVPDDALTPLPDATLGVRVSSTDPDMYLAGFLAIGSPADPPRFLPIRLADADPATPGVRRLLVHADDDGAPLPDKRGCAWYAGASDACRVSGAALGHPHGFTGTIAARCTADPLPP